MYKKYFFSEILLSRLTQFSIDLILTSS